MTIQLFAWVRPLAIDPRVDHTWVTTYDNADAPYSSLQDVADAGQYYWMCWGDFHPKGQPVDRNPVALGNGNLDLASCLVEPNADSRNVEAARGTIFTYGLDGVCHQLANQVLFATELGGNPPLTVKKANGYWLSHLAYGTYGRWNSEAWQAKVDHCTSATLAGAPQSQGASEMAENADEFAEHAKSILGDDQEKLDQLLELRDTAQAKMAETRSDMSTMSAEDMNAQNQQLFDEAAKLLGEEKFKQIFRVDAGESVNLVDPEMLKANRDLA